MAPALLPHRKSSPRADGPNPGGEGSMKILVSDKLDAEGIEILKAAPGFEVDE